MSSGLFACEKITFEEPFSGGKQVKVFVSPGNSTNGAAVWVESEDQSQFRACIYEYSDGSNAAAELNWIALESAPSGAQLGTTSLDSWTTGTKCKKVDFPQVSLVFKRQVSFNLVPRVLSYPPLSRSRGRVGENPGNEVE